MRVGKAAATAAPLSDSSAAKYLFRKRSLNDDELSCHSCGATGAAEGLCVCEVSCHSCGATGAAEDVCVCVCVALRCLTHRCMEIVLLQRLVLSVAQISVAPQTQAWK